jgi:molybdopterin-synthase adenylyltransferase
MSRLVLTAELMRQLRTELLAHQQETCAVLWGREVRREGRAARIVVREARCLSADDYLKRSDTGAELRPQVVAEAAQRARATGESIVFVHTHPFALDEFSATDNEGEKPLAAFLAGRTPGIRHAAMLITPGKTIARVLGTDQDLEVVGVGPSLIWGRSAEGVDGNGAFDRQTRVFGPAGQAQLRSLRVGIVGLGGTGSLVLEQLAHLGIGEFLLLDPDIVEVTNLNRLVGAAPADVGRAKVTVAAEHARRINPSARIETLQDSVLRARIAEQLADVDFVFGCTDTHGSRAVLNQLAYQYLVPMVDMGVVIAASDRAVSHVAGRTQMLVPGLGCLQCGSLLNPEAVRVDLLADFERQNDPYIVGTREAAPAVISLNATMASVAVTMFLGAVVGIPTAARLVNYDAISGTMRPAVIGCHPNCIVCSVHGALARANEWPLPARQS